MSQTTMGEPTRKANRRQVAAAGAALDAASHRFSLGAFNITTFSDRCIMLPAGIILPDTAPEERPAILKRLGGTPDIASFQVNIPLIRKGSDLILVDNNSGDKFQPSAGELAANLRAAGIDPASVTKVVFTDAYPGHAGGTVLSDGKLRAGRIDPWRRSP